MAQFVTHIQPTLMESSHHHIPGHHGHSGHGSLAQHSHHKECHQMEKDCKQKDCFHHRKDHKDSHHKDGHHEKAHYRESHHKDCHQKDCSQKDCHIKLKDSHHDKEKRDSYHEKEHSKESPPRLSKESLKETEHYYKDSHGHKHSYDIHFVDSQGICRESEVRRHGEVKEVNGKSIHSKSEQEITKPVPPQYIDIHPVHTENKSSDGNTSFLRAARAGHLDKVLEHLSSNIDINTSNANGLNALHLASKDGHVDVVTELLKRGAVVDSATKKGNTALHIASLAGQEEVVKLLVQHGASVNVQSQNGFTPLYMAAQENHDSVVKYLLANGANQSLATEDGFTPLAVAMQQGHDKVVAVLLENDTRGKVRLPALHIAAKKDDVKAAKLLLENEHNPDVTSKSGFTPLHIASHYGNESIANLLIQKGADVNYAAKHNITPLHVAAKWGKTNMVALLLEKGANIESKTRDGLTPLHCAARSGHEQVVDMLLERGAPISSKTKNGLAPLHMAAQGDHVDAARILLYHRAPVDEVTVDYLTALHVAAHCGHARVAKLLLDRQADANARALNGFTPLHIACKKNRIKVVELLLKHGASIGATTESGLTPLHVASFMGCMNIVIYLLQHEANPDVPTVRGETPLHLAARANQTDIIRILLRNGAQVDARAREQQTPLHIASRLGNVDIVMLLLQHGAQVDTTTKDMYTALHIAAKEGQDEVAAVLLDHGASLTATTKKGFTPLHLAAKYGNMKVAKLLLQKEAPVDAQGKNGVTPLHVASHYDHQNVALLLLDKGASPHATAKNGHTPLHIAAKKNQMDIATTLLEYGAQANAESKAGFTPLHLSSQEGHTDMSSLLIEHHADTNHHAKNGLTPLHLCAQEDRVDVAQTLVKNGAEVDAVTKAGYTPLHVASHFGQINMVRFLLQNGSDVKATTNIGYTPLHQAAQQGHANAVNLLLEHAAQPNATTNNGQTPLQIAQKLGYISVAETLKVVTKPSTTPIISEEKYRVVAPEAMHETFMSDSEEEGGEDTMLADQPYRYLTVDEMKSLGDDSLPIDVTRDERVDSNRMASSGDVTMLPPQAIEDSISPQHMGQNYSEFHSNKYTPDNVDIGKHPINVGFLVSFLVDARGGAMRGCRHSGVRVIVPPRCAASPTRITCRYVKPQRTPHPPPLMEGEALASRVLELGPVGAKFLGPVILEVPHFAALRGKEREIVILRSDNGETWREHTIEASDEIVNDVLNDSFEAEDLSQLEDVSSGRITRILTHDFPQYFAVVSRIRQEVHAIGPEGGMVSSTVVPQVQAVFPQGALTKKIKVGLQAQPIDPELAAKLLGHGVAVSPVVTVEPRRRKFHKAITLSMPAPRAHSQGMINQYSGSAPTLRLLCSITGGTTRAQWEDVTGSTPLTFVNDCVSFTTTVSARFWLMDCRNIGDATKMATELYREAIHVPFMAKFVVFAKRIDPLEARLRVFCMTDDKEDKTLEHQEHFTEVAKSRDVEVLEGKPQYIEFAGNLVPITKSGEQLQFAFRAFRENRLPFSVRVKDQHADTVGRCLFMREPKVAKGEPPQQPICILNIVLPDDIVAETISLTEPDTLKKHGFIKDDFYQRTRLSDMSNLLGDDWVPLAAELGLSTSEINVIKSEYPDSVAKQAQSMLRMWRAESGNKAQKETLEEALRRIGREDIVPQCLNVDALDHAVDKVKRDQGGFESFKEELGPSRDASLRREISLDTAVYERDIMKDSESVESLVQAEKKDPFESHKFQNIRERDESKYSAEEKAVSDEEEDFKKSVQERKHEIEKRLSEERKIPASTQRVEIVQEISSIKRQSLIGDQDVVDEVNEKPQEITTETIRIEPSATKITTTVRTVTTSQQIPDTTTKTTVEKVKVTKTTEILPDPELEKKLAAQREKAEAAERTEKPQIETKITTIIDETRTSETTHILEPTAQDKRRDSELFEGVTQELERLEATQKTDLSKASDELKSPKLSKTPPPSPADFILREQAASIQEWGPAKGTSSAGESVGEKSARDAAHQETSGGPLTNLTKEGPIHLVTNLDQPAELTLIPTPKPKPRVDKTPDKSKTFSDDTSTIKQESDEGSEDTTETYSDKKKFWENVTSSKKEDEKTEISVKKRMSLFEEQIYKQEQEQISSKKRTSVHEISMVPPVPKPRSTVVQSSSEEHSSSIDSQLQNIREVKEVAEEKPEPFVSEYKSAFKDPNLIQDQPIQTDKQEDESVVYSAEQITKTTKTESIDSESEYLKYEHQAYENPGYISESDHELDTSIKEDLDSIPKIKRRQMSISQPPVAATRKTIFERSVSLPTEDLQDVSAKSVKARKQYFEQQIKNEMVIDQLMTQLEEEEPQEYKTLASTTVSKKVMSPEEKLQVETIITSVRETEKDFNKDLKDSEKKLSPISSSSSQDTRTEDDITQYTPTSVKDLAKYFQPNLMCDYISGNNFPLTNKPDLPKDATVLEVQRIDELSATIENLQTMQHSSTESEQSISSERSIELGSADELAMQVAEVLHYRSDNISRPSDSLEVHVDKSEIEDSEKVTDIEQDGTDGENKSFSAEEYLSEPDTKSLDRIDMVQEELEVNPKKVEQLISPIREHKELVVDTTWEVSIQSQPMTEITESVTEIPIERQVIVEKDEELSEIVKKESEKHLDHSESCESEKVKSDHSEVEQLLLESLYHQKVNPDDARKIASELVSDIEAEIERRNLLESNEIEDTEPPAPPAEVAKNQISDYLRQLAEAKGLDAKEVELVETVLARKHSELSKLGRHDTQTSSMEITDEDLKYSAEYDISPSESQENILEEQIEQLEFESQSSDLKEKSSIDEVKFSEKSSDSKSRDILAQQDREFYAEDTLFSLKSETAGTIVNTIKDEKDVLKKSENIVEDNTSVEKKSEQIVELKSDKEQTALTTNIEIKSDINEYLEKVATNIIDAQSEQHIEKSNSTKTVTDKSEKEETVSEELNKKNISLDGSKDIEISSHQLTDAGFVDLNKTETTKARGSIEEEMLSNVEHKQETIKSEDGTHIFSEEIKEKTQTKTVTTSHIVDHKREEKTSVTTYILDAKDDTTATLSDDSKSSTYESAKSPGEQFSSSSSPRKDDTDTLNILEKPEVILRKKLHKEIDTSSSSSNLKIDRRSGADFEAYSSSGESHYHSFEDSARSRPCSSDVEGLVAAGSSEYESALTSQDVSSKSHITSTEYHTAVSSISSQSMKSLDSESSGHLGSIEVSEASETLVASEVPSNFDLDGDILDGAISQLLEDDLADSSSNGIIEPYDREIPEHVIRGDYQIRDKKSSFDTISDSDIHGESMDISEEDSPHEKNLPGEITGKMKRSQEMTFQPIPKAIIPDSPQSDALEMDERFGTSLEDGSVLSVSLSSQSDVTALRTVIEQSRRDSDRLDGSLTMSGHDSMTASNQSLDNILPPASLTTDISTSTGSHTQESFGSVTLTTSTIDDNGIQSVSTQVTSQHTEQNDVINGPTQVEYVPEYDDVVEPKKIRGHRRQESTSFVPSMISGFAPLTDKFKSTDSKLTESVKHVAEMTLKEEHHEETKDVDEMEESYETEADQCFHRQQKESGVLDTESDQDADKDDSESRPHSRISKTDSEVERGMSTAISEDKDSELIALMNQGSMDVFSEPIERPLTPEPPLESRGSIEGIPSLPTTPKSKICGSEKSSIEEGEAEAAFSMVAHISPAHKAKGDICPIMEDEDAEKHELETRERAQKELEKRRAQILRDQSPGNIPDIMVTEHMTPLVDREFHYPDLELEEKEALAKSAPQTPASVSSKSSEDTDQGREYILDDTHQTIPEEPETESAQDDKHMTESKSEISQSTTVEEKTVYEPEPKEHESLADSPNSDSFEMLEQPDIIDDFVVIEEVAKEAAEQDEEGKSVQIKTTKYIRKHDEEVEEYLVKSAPTPLTRMTELKYYPDGTSSGDEVGPFDFEDSPPQAGKKSTGVKTVKPDSNAAQSYGFEYDRELEASKKWIEMQFQGDQAAMINAGYGYEMEFERGPLEDIKEEEATDFESSRIGSLDSQKHSIGSLGSVKDSFSSTPEYDVLAGRKFFTRSGEHDDVSMSSLQEFEHLERVISLENRRHHQGSQDSSSNGSFSKRYQASRSGQGDDVSMSSLKEFEGLETACIEAHKIEVKAKEEEALLAQIDEAQENLISESESCKSASNIDKKNLPESEEEDYEKRMFEIDEIIKQAQSNVEKFIDMKDIVDKTESMGRGDSLEEVAKVPDLELDEPLVKSTVHTVKWGTDDIMQTSTDSLDQKVEHRASIDSLDMKTNAADLMTASTDSIEFQIQSKPNKDNLMTDSIDIPDPDRSYMITSDSLELTPGSLMQLGQMSDSIDEDGSRIGAIGHDQSSSSGFSMSKDEQDIHDQRAEYLLGSTDSLEPTSSTATHATYQYETDSVMSGSFTSGGSNTMVSSTDTIDPLAAQAQGVDLATAVRKVWFDEDAFGAGTHFTTEILDDGSKPYVTEVIEPCEGDSDYSHTIHRKVQLPPEIKKITFKGPDADLQLRQYIENFGEGEDVHETQETDKDGNIHVKRVVQKRFVVKSDPSGEEKRISGPELESYLQQVTHAGDEFDLSYKGSSELGLTKQTYTDRDGTKIIYGKKITTQQGEETAIKQLLSSISSDVAQSTTYAEQNLTRHVDNQQEQQSGSTSTTFSGVAAANILRDEAPTDDKLDESESAQAASQQRNVTDQHQLSSEMKELLEEMEKQSKQ